MKVSPNPKNDYKKEVSVGKMAFFALDFAFIIAVPLLAFIFAGKWLDARYGTGYFVIIGILLAIGVSAALIYKRVKEATNNLDQ